MQLLHAHAALTLAVAFVVFVVLALLGVHVLLAIGIGLVAGWLLIYGVFNDAAGRLEHWMTTMR